MNAKMEKSGGWRNMANRAAWQEETSGGGKRGEQVAFDFDRGSYEEFCRPYREALAQVKMWADILDEDSRCTMEYPLIHHVECRIKKEESVREKLRRKGLEETLEDAGNYLTDIAGLRVICYFIPDVYQVADALGRRPEVVRIKEHDYIAHPKASGYRSRHLVLGIPVCHMTEKSYYPVEIQLRTLAMDFWASMEHRICYKGKGGAGQGKLAGQQGLTSCAGVQEESGERFRRYARELAAMEEYMKGCLAKADGGQDTGFSKIFHGNFTEKT